MEIISIIIKSKINL